MRKLAFLVFLLAVGRAGAAGAEINEFTVNLSPQRASLLYEVGSISGLDMGCGDIPNQCLFGLEMDVTFHVDAVGAAQAVVTDVELHGQDAAFAAHPEQLDYMEANVASIFETSLFYAARGPESGQTVLTTQFPTGAGMLLDFNNAELMSLAGIYDLRPVDGPKYSFAYAVPEPGSLALFGMAAGAIAFIAGRRCETAWN